MGAMRLWPCSRIPDFAPGLQPLIQGEQRDCDGQYCEIWPMRDQACLFREDDHVASSANPIASRFYLHIHVPLAGPLQYRLSRIQQFVCCLRSRRGNANIVLARMGQLQDNVAIQYCTSIFDRLHHDAEIGGANSQRHGCAEDCDDEGSGLFLKLNGAAVGNQKARGKT